MPASVVLAALHLPLVLLGVQEESAPGAAAPSTAWVDVDRDGLLDLFVADAERGDRLLRNLGDGTFEDVSAASRLGAPVGSVVAGWCDADGDGFADLYRVTARGAASLWRNAGDGTFVEVTREAGVLVAQPVLGARWIDYDRDGAPDLEVRTAAGPVLHHNDGAGHFTALDPLLSPVAAALAGSAAVASGASAPSAAVPAEERPPAPDDADRAPGAPRGGRPGAPAPGGGSGGAAPTAGVAPAGTAGLGGGGVLLAPDAICAQGVTDQASPAECLPASSVPQLGHLYPFGPELNVDATGAVGIGTTSPTAHVHVLDASTAGSALKVEVTATSGLAEAVRGETLSPTGVGVLGQGRSTIGANTGVFGITDSDSGTGVYGRSGSATGATFGVRGDSSSSSGTGVRGRATATSGPVKGVHGVSLSPDGHAGYFEGRGYFSDSVGIGTPSPAALLDVAGTARAQSVQIGDDILLMDSSGVGALSVVADHVQLQTASDILLTGGPVGVNTTTPTAFLDVAGSLKAQTFQLPTGAASGRILTSDASGNATWQPAPSGGVGGSGTVRRLAIFTGTTTLGDSELYEVGGRVGVGTTTPAVGTKLDVAGVLNATEYRIGGGGSITGTVSDAVTIWGDILDLAADDVLDLDAGTAIRVNTTQQTHMVNIQSGANDRALRLIGTGSFGSQARFNFGDADYVYIEEDVDDHLAIHANRTRIEGASTVENALHVQNAGSGTGGATIYAENTSAGQGIAIHARTYGTDGTVVITQNGTGSIVRAFNGGGSPVFEVKNSGRVVTTALQITGGGDLVEGFETGAGPCEPGSVVVIDPARPGALVASSAPYDTKVAGVVSGAGGVEHGIHMGQDGTLDGDTLVAMTGRVYVRCTAANGAIAPGDLLTTAALPGRAMKATDSGRAFGAVIGKAMTALESGEGLVLVLVNLQ